MCSGNQWTNPPIAYENQTQKMTQHSLEIVPQMTVPEFLLGELKGKLAYVDRLIEAVDVSETKGSIQIFLRREPSSAERENLEEKIQRVVTSLVSGAFEPTINIIEDHSNRPVPYDQDPMPVLLKNRDVVQEGPGYFVLGPNLSRLVDYLEKRITEIARTFNADPYRFPAMISPAYLERVKYLENFPQSLSFVTHLREDLDAIKEFSEAAHCEDAELKAGPEHFSGIQAMLSPTVCHHLYLTLADLQIPEGGIVATASGHCFRYESINMVSLERVWNFTMREIIFVGEEEFVSDRLDEVRNAMSPLMEDFGLAYRIENANDPFFIGNFRDQAAYQNAFNLKYEVRAVLPFKETTIAVGSYNKHQDFFGRTLGITLPDGTPAHTGCVGIGFERFALAVAAQYGPHVDNWPEAVRSAIEA